MMNAPGAFAFGIADTPSRMPLRARTWEGSAWIDGIPARRRRGSAACLFIHGLGEGGYVFEPLVPRLALPGIGIVPDLRGHGDSPWDAGGVYSVADHTADIEALCWSRAPGPLVVIGHSLGGDIALRLAARGRLDIRGLALIDYGPEVNMDGVRRVVEAGRSEDRIYDDPADHRAYLAAMRPLSDPAMLDHYSARALGRRSNGHYGLKRDGRMFAAMTAASAAQEAERQQATLAMWSALGTLECPLLVLRGEMSAVLPAAVAQRMGRSAPEATVTIVAGAGHAVMADNPAGVIEALRPFVSACA